MNSLKPKLLSSTVIPVMVGAGIAVSGALVFGSPGYAFNPAGAQLNPIAKSRPVAVQLAQCNPCAAKKACNPCNPCAAKKACNPCNPCAAKKACNPCNPCAAKKACNPCNPCAAKKACNPCNPCAAKACNPCAAKACNPCNPCAGGGVASKCVVPRLAASACNPCAAKACNPCNPCNPCAAKACNPCNPCAAKKACNPCNPCAAKKACNPCNPCAAKKACNPCNPCAAKACNPCNPCAAKKACNPCNPCAAKACNPCNPCGAGAAVELSPAEARAAYDCLKGSMAGGYAKAGVKDVQGYSGWTNVASSPYQSATHGNRYVNNFANKYAAYRYKLYEKAGSMPVGSVIAKDSFLVKANGKLAAGPLFIMKKMPAGFSKDTGNWQYSMIMPNGKLVGTTNGKGSATMKFCAECHASVAEDQDSLFFLPAEYRVK